MKVLKKISGTDSVPSDLLLLLLIGGLYFLSIALSNAFVNVYLWKQSKSYIDIGLYNLMIVIFQPLMFIIGGWVAKRIDRVIVLRFGVCALAVFFITVLLLGGHAGRHFLLLGTSIGIGFGLFWLAFDVLTFEITEPETRDFFNGFLGVVSSLSGMAGPLFAGWIISKMADSIGYQIIFSISLGLFLLAVIVSFFLKRRGAEGRFIFPRIIRERKLNEEWRAVLNAHFFQGIREGLFLFVIAIWVFVSAGSEMALGVFSFLQSGVMVLSYFLATHFIKPFLRKRAILIGSILLTLSVLLIAFKPAYHNLILYAILTAVFYPVLLVPYQSMALDVIGSGWKAGTMRIEYIVVKELFYNLGRFVSIAVFLAALKLFEDEKVVSIFLILTSFGYIGLYWSVRMIHTKQLGKKRATKPEHYPDGESPM